MVLHLVLLLRLWVPGPGPGSGVLGPRGFVRRFRVLVLAPGPRGWRSGPWARALGASEWGGLDGKVWSGRLVQAPRPGPGPGPGRAPVPGLVPGAWSVHRVLTGPQGLVGVLGLGRAPMLGRGPGAVGALRLGPGLGPGSGAWAGPLDTSWASRDEPKLEPQGVRAGVTLMHHPTKPPPPDAPLAPKPQSLPEYWTGRRVAGLEKVQAGLVVGR